MRFFTSDTHFGHRNIIKYCNRPFVNVFEMDKELIRRWNCTVSPEDTVYFLGDFAMNPKYYKYLENLNFRYLIFIVGNHDNRKKLNKCLNLATDEGVLEKLNCISVMDDFVLNIGDVTFHATHKPIDGSDMFPVLAGHVHEKWRFMDVGNSISENKINQEPNKKTLKTPILNVGVDVHDFYPISEDRVMEFFNDKAKEEG